MTAVLAGALKLFTSLFGGGITGVVANWLNNRKALKELELKYQHEEKMREADAKLLQLELASVEKRTIAEAEAKVDVAEAAAKKTAFRTDTLDDTVYKLIDRMLKGGVVSRGIGTLCVFGLVCVEMIRKMIRPFTTAWIVIGGSWLVIDFLRLMSESGQLATIYETKGGELFEFVLYTTSYIVGMVLGYWFCERNRIPPPKRVL